MAQIKYHLIQKGQPGVAGGGDKRFYASITQRNHITLKPLSEEITDGRTLMAVLISLSRKIPSHLLNGDIIELGDMGNLSVNISSKGTET